MDCPICRKKLTNLPILEQQLHLNSCLDNAGTKRCFEKIYENEVMDDAFDEITNSHMKKVKISENVKPKLFICVICGKELNTTKKFRTHMKICVKSNNVDMETLTEIMGKEELDIFIGTDEDKEPLDDQNQPEIKKMSMSVKKDGRISYIQSLRSEIVLVTEKISKLEKKKHKLIEDLNDAVSNLSDDSSIKSSIEESEIGNYEYSKSPLWNESAKAPKAFRNENEIKSNENMSLSKENEELSLSQKKWSNEKFEFLLKDVGVDTESFSFKEKAEENKISIKGGEVKIKKVEASAESVSNSKVQSELGTVANRKELQKKKEFQGVDFWNLDTMSVEELRNGMLKFGLKPTTKAKMIQKLKKIGQQMGAEVKDTGNIISEERCEIHKVFLGKSKKCPVCKNESVENKITDYIKNNSSMYEDVLMLQEVEVNNFKSKLAAAGIRCGKTRLMNFLDKQGIYTRNVQGKIDK